MYTYEHIGKYYTVEGASDVDTVNGHPYLRYPYNPYTLLCMSEVSLHTCSMSRLSGGAI